MELETHQSTALVHCLSWLVNAFGKDDELVKALEARLRGEPPAGRTAQVPVVPEDAKPVVTAARPAAQPAPAPAKRGPGRPRNAAA
jgi:hypothetical protein